ncbi:Putative Thioesterase family protein [[Torrubiella] hemipterigena]|uniref:Putative Thioesterase family protein n=1 Tax=[Torrubiella] hemipterigena TaxID=1531966 RepID=A0A0A1TF34_9HYPO|nr:Putative Thioesterase family protein [[Torrubiella] hemipterigena]
MFCRRIVRAGARFAAQQQPALRRTYADTAREASKKSSISAAKLSVYAVAFTSLGAVGSWQLLSSTGMGFYSDKESLTRFKPTEEESIRAEETINSLPIVAELRADPNMVESRPHMKMPTSYREKTLTGGVLSGPGKVSVPPFVWSQKDGESLVAISYVSDSLCGHPGIVHGGFLATMLDEGLARCCFPALPHKIGVTANLNIDYRKPTPANSYLVLKATTTKVDGRKAWVKGHIELLAKEGEKPVILAEATGLFVSPKYAAMMPRIA